MIEAKKEGHEIVATPEPEKAKVVDIMDALKASLAAAKKPAAKEQEAPGQEDYPPQTHHRLATLGVSRRTICAIRELPRQCTTGRDLKWIVRPPMTKYQAAVQQRLSLA